jgi:nitroreductase
LVAPTPPPGELYVDGGGFVVAGLSFGNVFVGIQPPRGFGENPIAIYHDPDLPPTHHYLAAYWWIIEEFGAAAIIYAARSLGLGSTPMIGFDAEAVHREFGLAEDEVPVMLLSVGAERPGNWPQKPRLPVAEVLNLV